jgi:threonyl-tRNA synthetase
VGIPVSLDNLDHLRDVVERLRVHGIRAEVDAADDRMQKKIRNAQKQKVPFMLIAGADDVAAGAVSFRFRDGTQDNGVPVDDAVARIVAAVQDRAQV